MHQASCLMLSPINPSNLLKPLSTETLMTNISVLAHAIQVLGKTEAIVQPVLILGSIENVLI